MANNLLRPSWANLDSHELRILLDHRIGGPGQYEGRKSAPDRFYLPLAGASSRVVLTYDGRQIVTVEPGVAFEEAQWASIVDEVENSVLAGPTKVGRDYSFSGYRVEGSWRGERSGVQILPPPADPPWWNERELHEELWSVTRLAVRNWLKNPPPV